MKQANKKKPKKTKDFDPSKFASQAEAEEGLEEYTKSQPIYNYFQFFIGGPLKVQKNKQEGKPGGPPPY